MHKVLTSLGLPLAAAFVPLVSRPLDSQWQATSFTPQSVCDEFSAGTFESLCKTAICETLLVCSSRSGEVTSSCTVKEPRERAIKVLVQVDCVLVF